jgi:hypothetical protein
MTQDFQVNLIGNRSRERKKGTTLNYCGIGTGFTMDPGGHRKTVAKFFSGGYINPPHIFLGVP